jgi:ABC toxin N-terminal region
MARRTRTERTRGRPKAIGRLPDLDVGKGDGVRGGTSWDALKGYRVWAADRKVFVYPENWLDP